MGEGHSITKKGRRNYIEPELMNDIVDKISDLEYHRALNNDNFVSSEFPFERLRVRSKGNKSLATSGERWTICRDSALQGLTWTQRTS